MSSVMSPELVAAINASFTAGGWRMVGVFLDSHTETIPAEVPEDPPIEVVTNIATLQAEHEARGLVHVWTLSGQGDGYTSARLTAGGGAYDTTDPTIIARLSAAIPVALANMQSALIDVLNAPLPEPEEDQ